MKKLAEYKQARPSLCRRANNANNTKRSAKLNPSRNTDTTDHLAKLNPSRNTNTTEQCQTKNFPHSKGVSKEH